MITHTYVARTIEIKQKVVTTDIGSTMLIILHFLIEVPLPSHECETSCIC
jgi:hypothetical protein